jgi:hypothetical protein
MVFPVSNLATAAQPWGRFVEKSITNLEITTATERVNNAARDAQAALNIKRLDASLSAVALATTQAGLAATKAQLAIDALGQLDESTSTYKISADNVTVGTLTGITLVGNTIKTAASGTRLELSGTTLATYYNNSGTTSQTGSIYGALDAISGTNSLVLASSSRSVMYLSPDNLNIVCGTGASGASIRLNYGSGISIYPGTGATVSISGSLSVSGSYGAISASSLATTGSIDVGSSGSGARVASTAFAIWGLGNIIDSAGYVFPRNPTAATGTANVRQVGSGQELLRVTSARRYKHDIQDVDYGLKALNLRPRTWIDKNEYEKNGNSIDGLYRIPGFVAEEVREAGLEEMLTYDYETGELAGLSYDRMVAALIPVIKYQDSVIKDLSARIEALENK